MIGNIIFVRTENLIGKWIRQIDGGYYNHVGIMISDDELVEATYKGVKIAKLDKYKDVEHTFGVIKGVSESDIYSAISFAQCQVGLTYDFFQIAVLLVYYLFHINKKKQPLDIKKAYICSELVAEAFETVNINFNENIAINAITPHDLEVSELINLK